MVSGFDDETDVLTDEGWAPWPKIDGQGRLGTVNPSSGLLEYQRAAAVSHKRWRGMMYRIRSEQVDLLVTPEQPLWVQRYDTRAARRGEQPFGIETPEEILHKRVRYQKTAGWSGQADDVEIPPTSRSWTRSDNGVSCVRVYPGLVFPVRPFARFLGYYLAEGSLNGHVITLAQNRGPVLDEMAEVVRQLGLVAYLPVSGAGGGTNPMRGTP